MGGWDLCIRAWRYHVRLEGFISTLWAGVRNVVVKDGCQWLLVSTVGTGVHLKSMVAVNGGLYCFLSAWTGVGVMIEISIVGYGAAVECVSMLM